MRVFNHIISKLSAKILVLILIVITTINLNVFAGVEHFTNKKEICDLGSGTVVNVVDDKFSHMMLNPSTWQNDFSIKGTSDARVILKLDPTDKTIYPSFTQTATVNISYVDKSLTTNTITGVNLSLSYDPATGTFLTDQNIYHFQDAHSMTITVTSLPVPSGLSALPKGLIIQGDIDVERYYDFDYTAIPTIDHIVVDVDASVDRTLAFEWPVVTGAEAYDLEWTFVDDYNALGGAKPVDFTNNATRVTLNHNYYEIPLVFEKGYILYRVRAVGKLSPNFEQRVEGDWSSSALTLSQVSLYADKYYVNAHESDDYNWGYQAFYTENGTRGEGVSYFDGTLKNRQNISKLNTEDKVVVQETFYDYQGRPAVSVLPTPLNERFFKYRDDFNKNGSAQEYSASDFDIDSPSPSMSDASGASNYYSPQNPNQDAESAYIPDAEDYPFTQTLYKNDLTGRIRSQGGLGSNHRIGSGHESKFYYGKPLQHKLTKLFGTDVGFSKHYSETMVIDPNGQASVSVVDGSGRVVITNLAGDPPTNLEALPSHAAKEQITADILDNTIDENDGYGTIVSIQSYISKAGGLHEFSYSLDPETYSDCLPDGVCYDCVYDLEISVKDVDNMTEMLTGGPFIVTIGNNSPLNNTCENTTYNSPTDSTLKVTLPIGSYIITKTLKVNQNAIDYYADQYIRESTCLDDYHDFFDAFIAETDFSGCNEDPCLLNCEAQYGISSVWLAANPGMDIDDYNDLIEGCMSDCYAVKTPCEQYEYDMLADLSPGGQYGLYFDETNLIIDVGDFPLSIFNLANELPDNWSNKTTQTRGTGANWTNPSAAHANNPTAHYYEADGTTKSEIPVTEISTGVFDPAVYDYATNVQGSPGAYYVYPQHLLNVEDFLDNWKPSWGYALLPYHPEYCYLSFLCDEYDDINYLMYIYDSQEYDQAMQATNSYADALAAGYLNPMNNSVPTLTYVADDPFYTYLVNTNASKAAAYKASITSYAVTTGTSNLWDLAFTMVYCPSGSGYTATNISTCVNTTHSTEYFGNDVCKKDEVWRAFRDLYLANKAAYFDLEMTKYAIKNGCYNGCIGTSSFAKADFSFDCFPYPTPPSPTCGTNLYDANADYNTSLNQPCSDNTYANYSYKEKIFTTIYEDYPPSAFPPSGSTITTLQSSDIATFCDDNCEAYADEWIANLQNCSNIATVQTALKAELKELCELQCDPTNTTFPTTTTNGNSTVEDVIKYHITHANYTTTCHPLMIIPSPTQPIYDPARLNVLDDCGCDKVLQNEYDFANVTPLPAGVTTAEELFYHTYGFVPVNYQNINCECNSAAPTWAPSHTWQSSELTALSNLAMPVTEELVCESCLSCTTISGYKTTFDLSTNYGFLSSDPDYYTYLAAYINNTYDYNLSGIQVEEFLDNCTLLGTPGNTVWGDTDERLHLEMLLKKVASFGDLFTTTPFDLSTYIGTTSLEQYSNDYYFWSTNTNTCTNSTLELNIGTSGGTSQCTITLDKSTATPSGYSFDFCDIIKLDNLRKRGTTCANTKNFYIDLTIIDGTQSVVLTIEGTSSCYPIATCASSTSELALCKNTSEDFDVDDCTNILVQTAEDNALQAYLQYLKDEKEKIKATLKEQCMSAESSETFDMTYWDQEHHFTLYYYDQSGGLVQTVPPAGVQPFANPAADIITADNYRVNNSGTKTPPHTLTTKYRYNTYNQLTEQLTPDAGKSNFWYDIAGRLVASQNAKQASGGLYSYTIYDDFGRIIEVGEKDPSGPITQIIAEDPTQLQTWYSGGVNSQITRTFYDETLSPTIDGYFSSGQENLRLRVATVAYYETYAGNTDYDNAIHYSYDIAGNVKHAVMENTDLSGLLSSLKHLDYDYDLVSGNVKQVIFQEGETDQYYHKYHYDADNRIHEVLTSKDGIIWEKDAKYFYYDHGPLARIELGDEKVQGIDLAYTIQGWLRGVNSNTLNTKRDIGNDGEATGYLAGIPVHQSVAKDAFGYTLNYFNGDYTAISQPAALFDFEARVAGTPFDVSNTDLYNGNIKGMVTAINGMTIYGNSYKYDQLNRLRTSTVYQNVDATNNTWAGTGSSTTDYLTDITYDANGNILTLERNGISTIQTAMDDMTYNYYSNTNRLSHVSDAATDNGSYSDIKQSMASNNYTYDAIGNLTADPSEEIDNIEWTVYGKVKSITRTSSSTKDDIVFKYDAMGNRIMKLVKPRTGSGLQTEPSWTYNYYQYDAGGNLMAIYEKTYSGSFGNYVATYKQKEVNLYGSNRLGIDERDKTIVTQNFTANINVTTGAFTSISITSTTPTTDDPNLVDRVLGDKTFELSNHLGNVIATVTDKKIPVTGTPLTTNVSSGFEGDDFDLFVAGDYSSKQSTTEVRTGTYSIKTTSPTVEFGPYMHLDVKEGDVVNVSVYAKYLSGSKSGNLVIGLIDKCTGAWTKVSGNPSDEWYSTHHTTSSSWVQLNHTSYTVPSNLVASEVALVIQLWTPSGSADTYFDDLSVSITRNTTEIIAYDADIKTRQNYYPFGSVMPNSNNLGAGTYRYGMNGMERDNSVKGAGNSYTSYWRQYDPRLGRWLSKDPVIRSYKSMYNGFSNNPIVMVDPRGDDDYFDINGNFVGTVVNGTNNIKIIELSGLKAKEIMSFSNYSEKLAQISKDILNYDFSGNYDVAANIYRFYYNNLLIKGERANSASELYKSNFTIKDYTIQKGQAGVQYFNSAKYGNKFKTHGVNLGVMAANSKTKEMILYMNRGELTSNRMGDAKDVENVMVHERYHFSQELGVSDFDHLDAYYEQITHSSWNETTWRHKAHIIENIGDYFYDSQGDVSNSQWSAKLLKFENALGGSFNFKNPSGKRFSKGSGTGPYVKGPKTILPKRIK